MRTVACLFVDLLGPFPSLGDTDCWDETRDARAYTGPHPVVAFPPCKSWGRMWRAHERATGNSRGEDGGCFTSALESVRRFGGCLEHPWGSGAWSHHLIGRSEEMDRYGGRLVYIEQGWYGHVAPKATGIYTVGCDLWVPEHKATPHRTIQSLSSSDRRRWCTPDLLARALVRAARESRV